MANRRFYELIQTQGVTHTYLPVVVLPQGSSAPKLGEGDSAGAYFTITRNSAGNYTLKTKDAFPAIVKVNCDSTSGYRAKSGAATQNSDNTWSIPLYTATESTSVASVGSITAGTGYTSAPTVTFTGGGGTGAAGTATVASGGVTAVTITNPGYGYTSAPTVGFTGGGGTGAAGTAVLATGASADIPAGGSVWVDLVFRNSSVTP